MATIDPALRIRSVRLAVAELPASTAFYEGVLGLPLIDQAGSRALLGSEESAPALELVAIEGAVRPAPPRSAGLFHVAWLHPSREALADTVRRIAASRWPLTGASDHGVSEALYLDDPDGLGIEVYADRPREQWGRRPGGGYEIYTAPLDLDSLMATSTAAPEPRIAAGSRIGHVHLKVADVEQAARFYERLGFDEQARIPAASFLSAGGYHHHIGANTWQSAGGAPAPADAPGLREVAFELSGPDALDALAQAAGADAERRDGQLLIADADGQALSFSARA